MLEDIVRSRRVTEGHTLHELWYHSHKELRAVRLLQADSRMVTGRDSGDDRQSLLNWSRVSVFVQLTKLNGCTAVMVHKNVNALTELYI